MLVALVAVSAADPAGHCLAQRPVDRQPFVLGPSRTASSSQTSGTLRGSNRARVMNSGSSALGAAPGSSSRDRAPVAAHAAQRCRHHREQQ